MMTARDLTVIAGKARLLDSISIDIEPGGFLAVLGANGAGKSTLLKALSGEIRPAAGTVSINGRRLDTLSSMERARQQAVLPQESVLSADFLVHEVVLLGRTPHITSRASENDHRIVIDALDAAGVAHLLHRRYITLSGGERQRVHLARVLAQVWERGDSPRYLLLDEPTSSLDPAHQQRALGAARQFAKRGGGVMAILHDVNLAAQYADRIVLLRAGRVVASGAPSEVLTAETIYATFDLVAVVMEHPTLDCPLIVPIVSEPEPYENDCMVLQQNNPIEHTHTLSLQNRWKKN